VTRYNTHIHFKIKTRAIRRDQTMLGILVNEVICSGSPELYKLCVLCVRLLVSEQFISHLFHRLSPMTWKFTLFA